MATSTRLRPRRSEQGEALILTILVVGLAIIATVAAFLLSASLAQDTSRLASAKIDVANREDAVMRAILQQTALGMFPQNIATGAGLNWTPIMTNAVNQVAATTYIDPNEATALLGPGIIPANMADPDDGSTSLSIFQGYNNSEIPLGGTTGIANLVGLTGSSGPYNPAVEPPALVWVPNANISASSAVTNSLQFFLGSQVSSAQIPNVTSRTGRWGQLLFPNIRFGLMRPGTTMVARRIWWRIPVLYKTALQTIEAQTAGTNVTRYPGMLANYILSVYEIPSQLPITGNANIQLGVNSDGSSWGDTTSAGSQVKITGSIYGDSVQLKGGTYGGGISSRNQLNVVTQSSVAGETFNDSTYNELGVREQKDLARTVGAAPVSVAGDNGKVMVLPVAPGNSFYMPSPNAVATPWDLYSLPYYHCRIRITISGTNSTLNYSGGVVNSNAGAIAVQIRYLPDAAKAPDAVFGVSDSDPRWGSVTFFQTNNGVSGGSLSNQVGNQTCNFLLYTSTAIGDPTLDCNVLEIDLLQMYATLGLNPAQCYSIYIGCNPVQAPNGGNQSFPNIVLKDADDLTGTVAQVLPSNPGPFTNGLSIVSTQRIYLVGGAIQQTGLSGSGFNTVPWPTPNLSDPNNQYPAASIYAPDVRYGMTNAAPTIAVNGQVSVSQTPGSTTPINPLNFSTGSNTTISGGGNSYKLNAISDPRSVPPIVRLSWLFTIEKERTN
jgi:hypothetical protein